MKNYAAGTPVGDNGVPLFNSPAPFKAIAVNGNTNLTASSVITLTQNTTAIEIGTAGAGGALLKWISTSDTGASVVGISSVGATYAPNFDHEIPANTVRRFVVPIESAVNTTFGATITSVQGQNREYGLFRRVAVISAGGISSVLLTEYSKSNSY
jgi:hypothetical protein